MIKEVTAEEFNAMKSEGLVLADFFSTTCGPCKMLAFVLADADKEYPDVKFLKVDFDKNKDLTKEYDVSSYPTLILLKDGAEVKRMQGLQQKPAIIRMLADNQ